MKNGINVYKPKQADEKELALDKEVLNKQKEIDKAVLNMSKEYGGRPEDKGKEPTRYGDWELRGRCIDF